MRRLAVAVLVAAVAAVAPVVHLAGAELVAQEAALSQERAELVTMVTRLATAPVMPKAALVQSVARVVATPERRGLRVAAVAAVGHLPASAALVVAVKSDILIQSWPALRR